MTATAQPPAPPVAVESRTCLDRAEGIELLGEVHGCGYRHGAALVRRADGQMVQLGPLMYAVLECADGIRDLPGLADAVSDHLGRRLDPPHVAKLAEKLAAQGLLAGTEHRAPPRRNPLLALRWKVLVTNPVWTRRLTAPFTFLFRPWLMWPILAAFVATLWFVVVEKGVASATAQAFHRPELLLLVFALAVGSAGFHELGHAAAARYGGATPGGMGMGLYMVWPAFYTDVTDTYRLPRRDRLRVDLAGLYFNAAVAVITMGVWLVVRADALLLLVGLQVIQMVKQLSPVIRADGYHILADSTGVADLYAHMLPTVRRLLPGRRHEPSALSGRARLIVTLWVLVVVPVIASLSLSAIILLPRLTTTAWQSAQHIGAAIPGEVSHGQVLDVLAALVRLLALTLPVLGSVLVAQKITRSMGAKTWDWSRGSAPRRGAVLAGAAGLAALLAWAWWPAGQYHPIRGNENGTITGLTRLVSSPASVARPATAGPAPSAAAAAPVRLAPGRHLAVAMIPVDGASKRHPALYVIRGKHGQPAAAILSDSAPPPRGPQASTAPGATTSRSSGGTAPTAAAAAAAAKPLPPSATAPAVAFPFKLPAKPRPGDSQALATGTRDGGVTYVVAYSLVTVKGGAPVTNENSAYALASCRACTTVAVSFQVVLVVGTSDRIMPVNVAEALNKNCPACVTTAIANQLVITLNKAPSGQLLSRLQHSLEELKVLSALGGKGGPNAVLGEVTAVRKEIEEELNASGLPASPVGGSTSSTAPSTATSGSSPAAPTSGASSPSGSTATSPSSSAPTTTTPSTTATTPTTTSTTPSSTSTTPSTSTAPTTTTPSPTTTAPATTAPTSTAPSTTSGSTTTPSSP